MAPLGFRIPLIRPRVDLHMIYKWLSVCRSKHEGEHTLTRGAQSLELFDFLRVIDYSTREIIYAPSHGKHVALTYVWGKCDTSPSENSGEMRDDVLPDSVPAVIEGVMIVARELCCWYLGLTGTASGRTMRRTSAIRS
jgi:hypothetical protein